MAVIALLITLASSDSAWAQHRIDNVSVEIVDLMGGDCSRSWGTLRVTATNHSPLRMLGTLTISLWGGPHDQITQSLALGARGSASVEVIMPPNWCGIQACYEREGENEGCSSIGAVWPSERGDRAAEVLVLQRDLELRPVLSVASVRNVRTDTFSLNTVDTPERRPPIVSFGVLDGEGSTPVLPHREVGFGHLRMVMAEVNLLGSLGEEQERALSRWVQTGGELTIVARSAGEFAALSLVRDLVPGLVAGRGRLGPVFSPGLDTICSEWHEDNVPSELRRSLTYEASGLESTSYGSRAHVGLGTVHFVLVSERVHSSSTLGQPTRGARALDDVLAWSSRFQPFGWRGAAVNSGTSGMLPRYSGTYDPPDEREAARFLALDPNLNNRLPIWVYLLVVLVFTTLFFLIHHRWSRRGGRVWRMLALAGGLALAGCLLVFVLSWAARGPGARYCSMAWIETATGSPYGVMWRRLALASDQAGTRTLPMEPGLEALAPRNEIRDFGDRRELRFEASRWETVVAAEHGVVELEGTVELRWGMNDSPTTVVNTFAGPLRDTVLIVGGNRHYLGTIESGGEHQVDYDTVGASLPLFIPDLIAERAENGPMTTAVVGKLDLGCPDRGEFAGERCYTTVVVWGQP